MYGKGSDDILFSTINSRKYIELVLIDVSDCVFLWSFEKYLQCSTCREGCLIIEHKTL